MMKILRQWGFPIGLLALWAIAVAYTVQALAGLRSTGVPVRAAPISAIEAPATGHAS